MMTGNGIGFTQMTQNPSTPSRKKNGAPALRQTDANFRFKSALDNAIRPK